MVPRYPKRGNWAGSGMDSIRGGGGTGVGIISCGAAAGAMPLTEQEVEANAKYDGSRALMEVVTCKEVSIGVTTAERIFGWREDRVVEYFIYDRCSGGPAKNNLWEEGKKSVLIYFVDFKNKSQGGLFPSPSPYPPQTPGWCGFLLW